MLPRVVGNADIFIQFEIYQNHVVFSVERFLLNYKRRLIALNSLNRFLVHPCL